MIDVAINWSMPWTRTAQSDIVIDDTGGWGTVREALLLNREDICAWHSEHKHNDSIHSSRAMHGEGRGLRCASEVGGNCFSALQSRQRNILGVLCRTRRNVAKDMEEAGNWGECRSSDGYIMQPEVDILHGGSRIGKSSGHEKAT